MNELSYAETIDALCTRQCAFALYRLPGGSRDNFCMQADGHLCDAADTHEQLAEPTGKAFIITPFDQAPLCIRAELPEPPRPSKYRPLQEKQRSAPTTREAYHELFSRYQSRISACGETTLRKVVLARCQDHPTPKGFSPYAAYEHSCRLSPATFNALIHTPQTGTWLCSTPELLIRGCADNWETMALAGTRRISQDPWDTKNIGEQALVVDHVRRSVAHFTERLELTPPESLPAGDIEHLCSRISFRMSANLLPKLLDELQPTPAVSGYPVTAALQLLRSQPDTERGCYAGYLGPMSEQGAQFYVMLRCMHISTATCRLFAGGGLMPDSVEEDEWAETEAKMRPMLRLLNV